MLLLSGNLISDEKLMKFIVRLELALEALAIERGCVIINVNGASILTAVFK